MRDILNDLNSAFDDGRTCVYCSVVETRGSTPQKAGAAMLVFADGSQSGTLGGGCVEAEVKQRALRFLADDTGAQPSVMTFCLDDNYGWDDGLICGGRMSILVHPQKTGDRGQGSGSDDLSSYYRDYHDLVTRGTGCTEAVIVGDNVGGMPVGSRFLFDARGQLVAQIADGTVPPLVREHLEPLHKRPKPGVRHGVSYLPLLPRITLLIVGGGHVGKAVAQLGADVDFDIWILDDRAQYVSRERFPNASRLIVGDIGRQLKEMVQAEEITPSLYCLIITRGHGHDEEALYHLATTPAGYVGMIGSKRKIKLIYEDLIAKGIPRAALDKVRAPLGFNIGSQTVPEIAVSIVAELIACRNLGRTIPEARIKVTLG